MKTFVILFALFGFGATELLAQGHIAPCGGASDHIGGGICYGYAMSRAAGRTAGDQYCDPLTFHKDYINATYFEQHYGLSGMGNGDIVKFGNHVAYVVSIGNPISTTILNQYSTMRYREETVTLAYAESEFGSADGYYRVKSIDVTIDNSFLGGKILLWTYYEHDAGIQSINWSIGTPVSVDFTQNVVGKDYEYRHWSTPGGDVTERSITIHPRTSENYKAYYAQYFALTFQNSIPGVQNGIIKVGGTTHTAPFDTTLYKEVGAGDPSVQIEALVPQDANIQYTFDHWSDGPSTNPRSYQPPASGTVTAIFDAKPNMPTNVQAGGPVGNNVVVSWTDNPNSDVTQYRIYRKTKHGSDGQVASVNRGVGTWTDQDFLITGTGSDSMLTYSVYSYYSITGTLSDPASQIAWATYYPKIVEPTLPLFSESGIPTSFAVSNYPNPFNPSTMIRYELAKDASVSLEIYDVMGRKVRILVDGEKAAGYYSVIWNGRDERGRDVSSGTYFCRFTASPKDGQKPFTQSGKLLLTR